MNSVTAGAVKREQESYTLVNKSAVLFGGLTHKISLVNNKIIINKDSFRTRMLTCGF